MKEEEKILTSSKIDDLNSTLEGKIIDTDVMQDTLIDDERFSKMSPIDLEKEIDFDNQCDPSFTKEPKPFVEINQPVKRDPLGAYLQRIKKFPMLKADEEYELAKKWQKTRDEEAKEKIIGSHLRLVSKIAQGYRGYGMPLLDLISEGHIGMMKALEKFDPEKGARFSTYAMWWVKASMKEFVIRNWSLVKTGTTTAQKKLFFKLKSKRREVLEEGQQYLSPAQITQIAKELNVPEKSVAEMAKRLKGGDYSLNAPIGGESEGQWLDWVEDERGNHEEKIAEDDEFQKRFSLLENAMQLLKPRELRIMQMRRLEEPPKTLESIGLELNLSRERVRQIEMKSFLKLQKNVQAQVHKTSKQSYSMLN